MSRGTKRFLVVASMVTLIGAVLFYLRVDWVLRIVGIGGKFADLAMLSSAPIEFYGRVVDQDGKGLADVQVLGGTGSTTGFMRQETRRYTTTSDANGYFSFKGFSGDGLIVVPSKEGYHFESDRNRFHYAPLGGRQGRFTPEPKNPVVFQMWKALGPEPLVSYYGQWVRISTDGTPARIDLEKGTKVDVEGDLLVSITWGPRSDPGSYAFDWSLKLEVPSGGLIESTGDVRFLAPAEGYRKTFEYQVNAQQRQGGLKRTFYIMSRPERIFSRAEISIQNNPVSSDAHATFRVQLNPKPGSRILEPPNPQPTR